MNTGRISAFFVPCKSKRSKIHAKADSSKSQCAIPYRGEGTLDPSLGDTIEILDSSDEEDKNAIESKTPICSVSHHIDQNDVHESSNQGQLIVDYHGQNRRGRDLEGIQQPVIPIAPEVQQHTNSSSNPFSQFAHDLGGSESSYFTDLQTFREAEDKNSKMKVSTESQSSRKLKKKRKICNNASGDCDFATMTKDELNECKAKWQSFADAGAPIEVRRFQVLVAARLHCQAQDAVVRKAMNELRAFIRKSTNAETGQVDLESESKYLCPKTLSESDPEEISKVICSVLFANVKAKQIVQAAKEIKYQFNCKVPESKCLLKSITGIGPSLAELLFRVNSYAAYEET